MTPKERAVAIKESRQAQHVIISYFEHIIRVYDVERVKAEKALTKAQSDLTQVIARFESAPSRIVDCERKMRDLDKQAHALLVQPKLDKLEKLRAEVARLEREV